MQISVIVILLAAVVFLVLDDRSKSTELARVQGNVVDLQSRSNNQQMTQAAEVPGLHQQIQHLTQQRDDGAQEIQRLTAAQEAQRLTAHELAGVKTELTKARDNVTDLQSRLNNQQQQTQTTEIAKLQQQIQQLTQQRDRVAQENQQLTRDAQQRTAQEIAKAKSVPAPPAQPNWLQKRMEQGSKLDNPATPVGPSYWIDRYGNHHYY